VSILLHISDLHVQFRAPQGRIIRALNGASLRVKHGEVLGVLGESGSGKTTLAKACLRLLRETAQVTAGSIQFDGSDLLGLTECEMQRVRGAQIALVWQEPGLALSPLMKIGEQIAEVFRAHRNWPSKRCREEAETLLRNLQLDGRARRLYDAYPHQLSGGQQQRVAIAQAMACTPALVIADEPTASLDSETEETILHLLHAFVAERNASLVLITHNPRILVGLADRVAVMYGGRVVEEGPLEQVFCQPSHPYTEALLACLPPPAEQGWRSRGAQLPTIPGSAPDPEHLPDGCTFAPRCAKRMDVCNVQRPIPSERDSETRVECFLHGR
jgi:oligopeptide/dipeptide ABC transporter ATP-binding protein